MEVPVPQALTLNSENQQSSLADKGLLGERCFEMLQGMQRNASMLHLLRGVTIEVERRECAAMQHVPIE